MTAVVVLLYTLAGLLGIAGLIYIFRMRHSGSLRTAATLFLLPAAVYAAAHLSATATATPQAYAQAPITAWSELLGRLGFWLGLAAAAGVTINLIRLRSVKG